MRRIKTFILRLYIDPELCEQIRGDLRPLPGQKTFPFKHNADLLVLLHCLVTKEVKDWPAASPAEEHPGLD